MTAPDPVAYEMRTANLQREAQRLRKAAAVASAHISPDLRAEAQRVEAQVRRRLQLVEDPTNGNS